MAIESCHQLLVLNATDYQKYPIGGAIGTIRLFLKYTRFQTCLVGITNDPFLTLGKWQEIDILGKKMDFLPVANTQFPFIPHKVLLTGGILYHRKKIAKKIGDRKVNIMLFVNREAYLPIKIVFRDRDGLNIFYKMTEAGNPLAISERKIGQLRINQFLYMHFFIKPMLKAATAIFSINKECRAFCEKYLETSTQQKKIKDVHHYIDYDQLRIYYEGAEPDSERSSRRIIFWGRVADVKGLDIIVESVELLNNKGEEIEFYIIGDGSARKKLEEIVDKKRLSKQIRFFGRQHISKIAGFAKKSDVFVMASHTEGIPTSMLEAMTFELPVVSTAVGGIPTLVSQNKNGLLVDRRNPSLFAECLKAAFQMNRLSVAKYNISLIRKYYSVQKVIEQMDAIMETCIVNT